MRICPGCETTYADGVGVCARDGRALIDAPDAPSAQAATAPATAAPDPSAPGTAPTHSAPSGPFANAAAAAMAASDPAPANAGFDSLVGATLAGRYLIIRRIGEGGMGAVYEAKHTIIGKRVAVKVLLEKFLTKSDFVARLLQEARLASAIGHEHIVDVTDFGTTDDGRAFVVMEFLDGESLAQLVMREAPLPVERSLRIARQVASALGAAHAKGIVHRDIKPENVYLVRRGDGDFIKVVDFGISKAVKQGQGDDALDYRLTHTGLLLGTPLYMSPEQARGEEDLDHRVDVWALGVMLYECLTGEVPFRANNYLGIISQVLTHEAIPPSKLRPELGISEAVETVVMHAMEKDRARRYATMSDVENDIDRVLAGDQNVGVGAGLIPATAPAPTSPSRGRILVWGAAAVALIGGVAMALARPDATEVPAPRGGATIEVVSPGPNGPRPPGSVQAGSTPQSREAATAALASAASDARLSKRPERAGNRSARGKVDRSVPRDSKRPPVSVESAGQARQTSDEVLRGALPSRSGEGYPDPSP